MTARVSRGRYFQDYSRLIEIAALADRVAALSSLSFPGNGGTWTGEAKSCMHTFSDCHPDDVDGRRFVTATARSRDTSTGTSGSVEGWPERVENIVGAKAQGRREISVARARNSVIAKVCVSYVYLWKIGIIYMQSIECVCMCVYKHTFARAIITKDAVVSFSALCTATLEVEATDASIVSVPRRWSVSRFPARRSEFSVTRNRGWEPSSTSYCPTVSGREFLHEYSFDPRIICVIRSDPSKSRLALDIEARESTRKTHSLIGHNRFSYHMVCRKCFTRSDTSCVMNSMHIPLSCGVTILDMALRRETGAI